jgi:hypothetical protein
MTASETSVTITCARCRTNDSVIRLGNALTRAVRRLFRRNLYACELCRICWHESRFDQTVPVRR